MAFADKDLAEKLLLVSRFKNEGMEFYKLADTVAAELALITTRGWSTMTDAELAELGLTSARLNAYVAFLTQFSKLMSNQAVTTINGRAAVDGIRNI